MTSNKGLKRLLIICIGIMLMISLSIGAVVLNASQARYITDDNVVYNAELQDFDVDFLLTYTSNGTEHTVSSGELADTGGVLRVSKENYPSLRLNLNYTGNGKCYCRFRISESWQHTDSNGHDVISPKALSAYLLDSRFYDNRSNDGYIYLTQVLKNNSCNISAITGCSAGEDAVDLLSPDDAAQFADISVNVEAVQWNQALKLWNIEKLPWEE